MQFSPQLGHQQFQSRQQISLAHMQHGLGQNQLNQRNQMNRLSQFSGHALFSTAQTTPNTQMIPNISARGGNPGDMMSSQLQQQQHFSITILNF
ncbi:hypothetical protein RYX36_020372 [Vicia faba]